MAYNKELAERITAVFDHEYPAYVDKKMFGGIAWMVQGNLAVGTMQDGLIVRLGKEDGAEALEQDNVHPFDVTGRPMKGWVVVDEDGIDTDDSLRDWVLRGLDFALTLPPK
jgi:TfoX/Sxy family transcriptional regulator of competence genes